MQQKLLPVKKQLKIKRAHEKVDTKIVIFDTTNRQTVAQVIEDYSEYYVFDLGYYLGNNYDLIYAFGYNYAAAFNHFVKNGCNEYRILSPVFETGYYVSIYPD